MLLAHLGHKDRIRQHWLDLIGHRPEVISGGTDELAWFPSGRNRQDHRSPIPIVELL